MRRSLNSLFDVYKEKLSSLASAMQNANNKIAQIKSDKAKDEAVEYTKSQIKVLNESISLKVEKSVVDKAIDDATKALTTKINDAKSEIKLTTDSITNRVSSAETNITTVTTKANNAQSTANTATNLANNAQSTANTATNLANAMKDGKMIHTDPNFRKGSNSVNVYNNAGNGNVVVDRITKPSECPSTSSHCLRITHKGTASPSLGGVYQTIQSRANAVFIQKFIAKLPSGYTFNVASNSMGTGYTDKWLTSNIGTGTWQEYIREVRCGSTGTFASGGHVYVSGATPTTSNPLVWYIAYATVIDVTDNDESVNNLTTEVTTTKNRVATVETNLTGITSRVSSVESKQTTTDGKLTSLETWKSSAEQKITDSAIISTVGKEFYKKSETDEQFSNQQSQISQLSDSIDMKVSKDNVVSSINVSPETIKLKASKIDMTGKLDLNGTFTCYADPSSKTGNFLYQSGAIHRGYLSGTSTPVFSSGIWNPQGVGSTGYVSVGWRNSETVDQYGCLWMSPRSYGGASLHYGVLRNSTRKVSGIDYYMDGSIWYTSSMDYKTKYDYYAHKFDGNTQAPCVYGTNLVSSGGHLKCNATVYTDDTSLYLSSNGSDGKYSLQLDAGKGYLYGGSNGGLQLGTSNRPFYQLYSTHSPIITSDGRKKEEIQYINDGTKPVLDEESLSLDDMYNYIKDLKIATYKLKESKEVDKNKVELGFIAQDVADTKVGKYVVDSRDEDNLVYSLGNRITVIEGALQKVIETLEELKSKF